MLLAVTNSVLESRIDAATHRVVLAVPALPAVVAQALHRAVDRLAEGAVTILIDVDEDAYRVGYGEPEGAQILAELTRRTRVLYQPGLRLGLLVADDEVLVWAPSPLAVEKERDATEPNGVALSPREETCLTPESLLTPRTEPDVEAAPMPQKPVEVAQVEQVAKKLAENPPGPFDLSRVTRVFASKYQFVEVQLQGAEWTGRELKLSSVLLNSDVPAELSDLLETRFRPFGHAADEAVEVPRLVDGDLAYRADKTLILGTMTQTELKQLYKDIRQKHTKRAGRFGWIVRRSDKANFERQLDAFEEVLRAWVVGFRQKAASDETKLVEQLATLIMGRLKRSDNPSELTESQVKEMVSAGLDRLRVRDPVVKRVFKNIAPESAGDREFLDALAQALPEDEMKSWYETFDAARESDRDLFSEVAG